MLQNDKYRELARQQLVETKKQIDELESLAQQSKYLVKLKDAIPNIQAIVADYESLADQSEQIIGQLAKNRENLDVAAAKCMTNAKQLLENQYKQQRAEITGNDSGEPNTDDADQSTATSQEKLLERQHKVAMVNEVIAKVNEIRVACFKAQAMRDLSKIEAALGNFSEIAAIMTELRTVTHKQADIENLDQVEVANDAYQSAMEELKKNWATLDKISKERGATGDQVLEQCQAVANAGFKQTEIIVDETDSSLGTASTVMLTGLIVTSLLGVVLALLITRSITKPIHRIIGSLSEGSSQVNDAAMQVSSASQQLASGASEQASALQETSCSLDQMAATSKTSAHSAQEANELSNKARAAAQSSDESMASLNSAMVAINESANEISKIIKVIEEIAFQTNLLALNAAVEAARAGEQGRGFAVVAEEVRNLALRAADAAGETTRLIQGAVDNAQQGSAATNTVADTFTVIVQDVTRVSELIESLSASATEQAQGVDQVNIAVGEMDKVTQGNSAAAEESAAAAEELSAQASTVANIVGELSTLVGGIKSTAHRHLAIGSNSSELSHDEEDAFQM